MSRRFQSTITRARAIRRITEEHYEPGNQARCYKAVWRKYIYPTFGICYNTYLAYLGVPVPPEQRPAATTFFGRRWDGV